MKAKNMALCGLFTAILALCAWLSIPMGDLVITLQTFGIFLTLGLLGGKRGSITICVYLLLGAVGAPVFSGFRGGLGALLGTTGGYVFGFMLTALIYWIITSVKDTPLTRLLAMILGMLLCYSCGSWWYMTRYLSGGQLTLGLVLMKCVIPYLIPDAIKLTLSWILTGKLKRFVY
jgi:biotin transport system substrate-specific component